LALNFSFFVSLISAKIQFGLRKREEIKEFSFNLKMLRFIKPVAATSLFSAAAYWSLAVPADADAHARSSLDSLQAPSLPHASLNLQEINYM
jgi:hypothetical protein